MNRIYPAYWLELPKDIRGQIAKDFDIPKNGITEVRDQTIVSDGYTVEDLGAITKEKMEKYVGSTESFVRLWELTIMKAKSELNPPIGIVGQENKSVIEVIANGDVEVKIERPIEFTSEEIKPWCDTCNSKGKRHKLGCPKRE